MRDVLYDIKVTEGRMKMDATSQLSRLASEILAHRYESVHLGKELKKILDVSAVKAWEATIFYAARIMEVLLKQSLVDIDEKTCEMDNNIENLFRLGLMSKPHYYLMNVLRLLGNKARHKFEESVELEDEKLALVALETILRWYFIHYPLGKQLVSLTVDSSVMNLCGDQLLQSLVDVFLSNNFDLKIMADRLIEGKESFLFQSPLFPSAVILEILIDNDQLDLADRLINKLNTLHPRFRKEKRLKQLHALLLSRQGKLDEALALIGEPRPRKNSFDSVTPDDEVVGIRGGILKRVWIKDPSREESLQQANRLYKQGWEKSKSTNLYLGINYASTSLWMGDPFTSRQTGNEIIEILLDRFDRFKHYKPGKALSVSFWDKLIFAEACILTGKFELARKLYCAVQTEYPDQKGNFEVATTQAERDLKAMELSWPQTWYVSPTHTEQRLFHIGTVGLLDIRIDSSLEEAIQTSIPRILSLAPSSTSPPALVTHLTGGVDDMILEVFQKTHPDLRWEVVLPLELGEYRRRFSNQTEVMHFNHLLNGASTIHFPEGISDDLADAIQIAEIKIVEKSDVVVALWDGEDTRTATILKTASRLGKPVLWIHSHPPHSISDAPTRLPLSN